MPRKDAGRMEKNVKCLVSGGAGFIGSHLCESLLSRGFQVICLDNLITGSKKNITHLKKNPNFCFYEVDITDIPDLISSELSDIKYLYHLASPASPPQYQKFSLETLLVNSVGTLNLLNLAVKNDSVFLLASTSEVYGDPLVHPQKETYYGNVNPHGLRACYDESKRFAEALSMEYFRKYKLDIRIVRIFNTYGPRMQVNDGRVISNFINQALSDQPLTIYGDGLQTRSFCFVDDLIRGLVLTMEKEKIAGTVINLGYPKEHTVLQLAEMILQLTGKKVGVKFNNKTEDDPQRRRPDIKKAQRLLSWEPRIEIVQGLRKTIEYFQNL